MRIALTATICAALVFCASTAEAYSPTRGHAVLSNFAVDLFNQCVERGFGVPSHRFADTEHKQIVDANMDEDRTRLLRRIFNWHFYNSKMENSQRVFFFVNRSFVPLFKSIESRLHQPNISWDEALRAIGRAIHFIEDFTVPSHIVPVFHGAGIHDAFEEFPISGTPSPLELTARISPNLNQICSRLSSHRPYGRGKNGMPGEPAGEGTLLLRDILDRTRSFTLARLEEPICDGSDELPVKWHYFWIPPQPDRYFGKYRQNAAFGDLDVITDHGLSCEITVAKYREFAVGLHLEAVFADVRALYWFLSRHARR